MEMQKRKGKQVGRLIVTEQQYQEDLQRLRGLRPIDDDFVRCLFKVNIPLAEFVLRIITDKQDLIISVSIAAVGRVLHNRSIVSGL